MGVAAPILKLFDPHNPFVEVAERVKTRAGIKIHDFFQLYMKETIGFAVSRHKYINAPYPRDMFGLYVIAHECAHVSLNHKSTWITKVTHEIEADILARVLLLAERVHLYNDGLGLILMWKQYIADYHSQTLQYLNTPWSREERFNELMACYHLVDDYHDCPNLDTYYQAIQNHSSALTSRLLNAVDKVYNDYMEERSVPVPSKGLSRVIA